MPLLLQCSKCTKPFHTHDQDAGKQVRCPTCGAVLAVPATLPATVQVLAVNAAPALSGPAPQPPSVPAAVVAPPTTPAEGVAWFIMTGGVRHGPLTAAQVRQMLALGQLSPADLAWKSGLSGWSPLSMFPDLCPAAFAPPPAPLAVPLQEPPPLPAHLAADAEWSQIKEIARWQRYLNLLALGLILVFGLATVALLPAVLVQLALAPLEFWLLFRLAGALALSQPYLWAAGGFVPFVNFAVLLGLSQTATGRLRAVGLRVGLLGAANVPEQRPPAPNKHGQFRRPP